MKNRFLVTTAISLFSAMASGVYAQSHDGRVGSPSFTPHKFFYYPGESPFQYSPNSLVTLTGSIESCGSGGPCATPGVLLPPGMNLIGYCDEKNVEKYAILTKKGGQLSELSFAQSADSYSDGIVVANWDVKAKSPVSIDANNYTIQANFDFGCSQTLYTAVVGDDCPYAPPFGLACAQGNSSVEEITSIPFMIEQTTTLELSAHIQGELVCSGETPADFNVNDLSLSWQLVDLHSGTSLSSGEVNPRVLDYPSGVLMLSSGSKYESFRIAPGEYELWITFSRKNVGNSVGASCSVNNKLFTCEKPMEKGWLLLNPIGDSNYWEDDEGFRIPF